MVNRDFAGKVAIITGAGGSIGRAIAIAFAKEGANIVIPDINLRAAEGVANEIRALGPQALATTTDATKSDEIDKMVKVALENFGRIDILVNNAGGASDKREPLVDRSEEDWDETYNRNLKSVFLCSRAVGKVMRKQKSGNIINIASIVGHMAFPLAGSYDSSKAGVIQLTKTLAFELARYGIRVNSISPGLIRTERSQRKIYADKEVYDWHIDLIPLRRIGETQDIANAALFLASEHSSYITGCDLLVDGGLKETIFWTRRTPKERSEINALYFS